jgi:hypothetical protein
LGKDINEKGAGKENDQGDDNPEIGGGVEKQAVWITNFLE